MGLQPVLSYRHDKSRSGVRPTLSLTLNFIITTMQTVYFLDVRQGDTVPPHEIRPTACLLLAGLEDKHLCSGDPIHDDF